MYSNLCRFWIQIKEKNKLDHRFPYDSYINVFEIKNNRTVLIVIWFYFKVFDLCTNSQMFQIKLIFFIAGAILFTVSGHEYEAVRGQFPYYVYLRVEFPRGIKDVCAGTLISNQWILTAGHCLKSALAGLIYVVYSWMFVFTMIWIGIYLFIFALISIVQVHLGAMSGAAKTVNITTISEYVHVYPKYSHLFYLKWVFRHHFLKLFALAIKLFAFSLQWYRFGQITKTGHSEQWHKTGGNCLRHKIWSKCSCDRQWSYGYPNDT